MVLGVLSKIESHLELEPETKSHPVVLSSLEATQQIEAQDVEVDEQGEVKLRKGVTKNRRITIEDEQMRHGRKNRSKRFDGYKRHLLKDLDLGMVRAVGITMANVAEASVTEAISLIVKLGEYLMAINLPNPPLF